MATDARSTADRPHSGPSTVEYDDRLVEQRIASARWQLRMVDLASGAAVLAIAVLVYFFALALLEHWLTPLSVWGRYAAWAALLIGGVAFLVRRLAPSLLRPINPIYAARAIEEGNPTLKNSLINFLLFRREREAVRPIVYQALQQQAAEGAARVSPEAVVDRSSVIRLGYVLAAVLTLFGIYVIAAPKDVLQTVQRVMAPWAPIAPPTRVQISNLTPGDATAYRGFQVDVAAEVRGLRASETVTLRYSTADGQVVDRPIEMTRENELTHRYLAVLPGSAGVTQDIRYRVEAGDAVSAAHTITALAEPTIVVSRATYQPPPYTGRQPHTEEAGGDLKALEQTLVTLEARANYELESATVEFDPDTAATPKRLAMEVAGDTARIAFRLELTDDRQAGRYQSYQLRIVTADGAANAEPILHTIEVVPDLSPEVQILRPESRRLELPQDGRQLLEARAIDPDFGLSALNLKANHGGRELFNQPLLTGEKQPRQQRGEFVFEPLKLGLPVGAEVVFWAEAADNRQQHPHWSAAPNRAKTEQYRIRITPPLNPPQEQEAADNQNSDGSNAGDAQSEQQPSAAEGERPQQPGDRGEENADSGDAGGENAPQNGEPQQEGASDEQQPQQAGGGGEGESAEESPGSAEDQQQGAGGESQQEGELGEGSGDQRAGNGSSEGGPQGADQQGSGGQQSLGEGGHRPGDQTGGEATEPGGDQAGEQRREQGGRPDGGGQQNGSGAGDAQQPGGSPADSQPLASDGTEDAEAFERIKEFLDQQQKAAQQQQEGAGSAPDAGQQQDQANHDPAEGQTGGQAGEGDNAEPGSAPKAGGSQARPGERNETTSDQPGGRPQGADAARPEEREPGTAEQQQPDSSGGLGQTGESGAGKPRDNDSAGSPMAQGENRDTPKNRPESGVGDKPNEEAQSPSISPRQSDSEGEQGDRSGGGGEGGGQGAKQPGNDSPGSTTAADEGAGAAGETGDGETGSEAGSQETAEGETGSSGEQAGAGSRDRPGGAGAPPGEGQTNNQSPGEPGSDAADPNNTGGQAQPGQTGGNPLQRGGGAPNDARDAADQQFPDNAVPPADEVNLDYARQATDLVLDELEQQRDQPDQELLDRLGWTPEQMQQFIDRWKALKAGAQQPGDAGAESRRELDDALQSLGLAPEASRKIETAADRPGGASDAGFRSKPPARYQRLYDAFRKAGQ